MASAAPAAARSAVSVVSVRGWFSVHDVPTRDPLRRNAREYLRYDSVELDSGFFITDLLYAEVNPGLRLELKRWSWSASARAGADLHGTVSSATAVPVSIEYL
jgi:hypothetical protein